MGYKEELAAMTAVGEVMEKLDAVERGRVLRWVIDSFGIDTIRLPKAALNFPSDDVDSSSAPSQSVGANSFGSLGELVEAAGPESGYDRIVVVSYWLQEVQAQPDFVAQKVNDELKNLGHPVGNITDALTKLMRKVPALVRQTRKEGTSMQARKRYAVTEAGKRHVLDLIKRRGQNTTS